MFEDLAEALVVLGVDGLREGGREGGRVRMIDQTKEGGREGGREI